jgi:hypothetical protein
MRWNGGVGVCSALLQHGKAQRGSVIDLSPISGGSMRPKDAGLRV